MSTKRTPTSQIEKEETDYAAYQRREKHYEEAMQITEKTIREESHQLLDGFLGDASVADMALLRDVLSRHGKVRHSSAVESILSGVFHEVAGQIRRQS